MNESPLLVVALGGNAVAPLTQPFAYPAERRTVNQAAAQLARLGKRHRLLIVHGNGPQVGHLLQSAAHHDGSALDICVAQSQGELGYLLCNALGAFADGTCAALVTRTIVDAHDAAFAHPDKPIGPLLSRRPAGRHAIKLNYPAGWRLLVASPRPRHILELEAIRQLLQHQHVIAGGGGGVALTLRRSRSDTASDGQLRTRAVAAVIDKDWVAALLARELRADRLLFATTANGVIDGYGTPRAKLVKRLPAMVAAAQVLANRYESGSMAPKIGAAAEFALTTGRPAVIASIRNLVAASNLRSGTVIH